LNDSRLSLRARGLAAMLISKPENWQVSIEALVRECKEGRDAIQGCFKELKMFGYADLKAYKNKAGDFVGKQWTIHEEPLSDGQTEKRLIRSSTDNLKNGPSEKRTVGESGFEEQTHNFTNTDKGNNKECGVPAQKTDLKNFVFPDLEEKKGTPQVPAAPLFGASARSYCDYQQPLEYPKISHADKPREIETHVQLFGQIKQYYDDNPEEWKTSVKAMSGPSYTDVQLNEMLQDYASHSFSRRNPRQTFAQHNADFCRWVKDQKNHTKPTQTPYTRPASNKMRTVEVETTGYSADQLF